MKKIAIFSILLVLTGCAAVPKSFDQGLQLINRAAKIAEQQGTSYSATIRWNGKLGGAWIQRGELDSGVTMEISFHGNAAAQRPSVSTNSN